MEQTNPEVIAEVEKGLGSAAVEHRHADVREGRRRAIGGRDAQPGRPPTEKGIMEGLEAEDPDLVEQIRRLMFVFEDILLVNDKGIQSVLKEVDNDELALALKTASEELKDKIFKNMSERAAQLIQEDMEYMGPVRVGRRGGAAEDRGRRAAAGGRRRDHHRRPRRRQGAGRVRIWRFGEVVN